MSDSSRYAAVIERMPEGERPRLQFFTTSGTWRDRAFLHTIPDDIALLALDGWFAERLALRFVVVEVVKSTTSTGDETVEWVFNPGHERYPTMRAAILAAAEREWA